MTKYILQSPQFYQEQAKKINNIIYKYYFNNMEDINETGFQRLKAKINNKNISKIVDDKTYKRAIIEMINKYRTYFNEPTFNNDEEYVNFLNNIIAPKKEPKEEQTEEQAPKDAEQSEITQTIKKEPLRNKGDKFNKIISGEQSETTDAEQSEATEEAPTEEAPTDKSIIPLPETKLSTNEIMETYNKIIDDFYNDTHAEQFLKRIKYISMLVPEEKFAEIAETEAIKLAQISINGVKPFKDIAEARQFIYDIRYGNNKRFKGQNQHIYKLPKLQKMIKQEQQKNNIISPMFLRNIKPLSQTKHIYEY